MYCGDDVSSVVFDAGTFNVRIGYSGEDCPRYVTPSFVGRNDSKMVDDGDYEFILGPTELGHHRENMKVENLINPVDESLKMELLD